MPFTLGLNKPHVDLTDAPRTRTDNPRERLKARRDELRGMNDDDLQLELIAVTESVAAIQADIAAEDRGDTTRGPDWRRRADTALNLARTESKFAHAEKWRRERIAEEQDLQRRQANFERQKLVEEEAIKRKDERLRIANAENNKLLRAFIQHARRLLDAATFQRILDAARAEQDVPTDDVDTGVDAVPAILDKAVSKIKARGVSTKSAYPIAVASLQKAGDLKAGSLKATAKGVKRAAMTQKQRQVTR